MKEVHTTALVDELGVLALEVATDLAPGAHELTLLVNEESLSSDSHAAALARQKLKSLLADWDEPEMSAYDAL